MLLRLSTLPARLSILALPVLCILHACGEVAPQTAPTPLPSATATSAMPLPDAAAPDAPVAKLDATQPDASVDAVADARLDVAPLPVQYPQPAITATFDIWHGRVRIIVQNESLIEAADPTFPGSAKYLWERAVGSGPFAPVLSLQAKAPGYWLDTDPPMETIVKYRVTVKGKTVDSAPASPSSVETLGVQDIAFGNEKMCLLASDGSLYCKSKFALIGPISGKYTQVSSANETWALQTDGTLVGIAGAQAPVGRKYLRVSTEQFGSLVALTLDRRVVSVDLRNGDEVELAFPAHPYQEVWNDWQAVCAQLPDATVVCAPKTQPVNQPVGPLSGVTLSAPAGCGVRPDGTLGCWRLFVDPGDVGEGCGVDLQNHVACLVRPVPPELGNIEARFIRASTNTSWAPSNLVAVDTHGRPVFVRDAPGQSFFALDDP
jgi:hypothetical protein